MNLSTLVRRALARRGPLKVVAAVVVMVAGGWLATRSPSTARRSPDAVRVADAVSSLSPAFAIGSSWRATNASASTFATATPIGSSEAPVTTASTTAAATSAVLSRLRRDREGARASALMYVGVIGERVLYASEADGRGLLRDWNAPEVTDTAIEETVAAYALARARLAVGGGQVWWLVAPLAVRVVSVTDTRAEIAVWGVRVLSSEPRSGDGVVPLATWTTTAVELVWVDAVGWSVSSVHTSAGPVPMVETTAQPATAAAFTTALTGFELIHRDGERG